jgi:photosystem II stability/assembly factor-like uncharacterized protein
MPRACRRGGEGFPDFSRQMEPRGWPIGYMHMDMNGSRRAAGLVAVAALVLAVIVSLPSSPPVQPQAGASPSSNSSVQIARWDFISFTTGWVEVFRPPGLSTSLYSTVDGGRSWRQVRSPGLDSVPIFDFQPLDNLHLLATTDSPDALWWSNDGGASWKNRSPPALNQVGRAGQRRFGHFFLDTRYGWLLDSPSDPTHADQPSSLWATTDGGVTWLEIWRLDPRTPEFADVLRKGFHAGLTFRNPKTGWLALRTTRESRLYRTDDGGHSWRRVTLPLSALLIDAVALTPDGAAIVISSNGFGSHGTAIISRDSGDHWDAKRQLPDDLGGIPFRIAFLNHDHWLYANGDTLFITDDAGQRWTSFKPSFPPGQRLGTEVRFADRLHGWADAGDAMLRSVDGGRTWTLVRPP